MEVGFRNSKLWSKRKVIWNSLLPFGFHLLLFLLFAATFVLLFMALSRFGEHPRSLANFYEHQTMEDFTLGTYKVAFKVFNKLALKSKESDVLLSPLSLILSVSMALDSSWNRSAASDLKRMAGWYFMPRSDLHRNIRKVMNNLNYHDSDNRFDVKTTVFLNKDAELKEDYLELLRNVYKAEFQKLDFDDVNTTRQTINERLAGTELNLTVPESLVNSNVGVLSSCVIFKGKWQYPFAPGDTRQKYFLSSDGIYKNVTLMHEVHEHGFVEMKGFKVLRLSYEGGLINAYFVMPENRRSLKWMRAHLLKDLKTYLFDIDKYLDTRKVEVFLPKFKIERSESLRSLLTEIGLQSIFSENLGMHRRYISDVLEQSSLVVDEAGTEASSATYVKLIDRESPEQFCATKPFIFFVRDTKHKTLLYLGQYAGS